jgi:hypothetical protein
MFPEADDVFEFAMGILLDAVTGLTAQAARAKKSAATASTTTTRKKA